MITVVYDGNVIIAKEAGNTIEKYANLTKMYTTLHNYVKGLLFGKS